MYDEEVLASMQPRMVAHYVYDPDHWRPGELEFVPKSTFTAYIYEWFPFVCANGELIYNKKFLYALFVGKVFEINDLLYKNLKQVEGNDTIVVDNKEISEEKLQEYQERGFTKVVSTKAGLEPMTDDDAVFSTFEGMEAAITKINQTFKSVKFSIENTENQIRRR